MHWCTVMFEQEEARPKLLGAWNCPTCLGMLKHSEFLSLEHRGQAQLLKKQPHTIIPHPPNFTLGKMQSDKYHSPGNPVHQIGGWNSAICHSRKRFSTARESSGGVLYTRGPQPPGHGPVLARGSFGTGPQRKNKYVILFPLHWRSYLESCFILKNGFSLNNICVFLLLHLTRTYFSHSIS